MNPRHETIVKISQEILDHLLRYKELHPEFTFSPRERDSVQSKDKRLESGFWFQGSDYIYVPLFKKGDTARKIKTLGFVINIDEFGNVVRNYIEISFKGGITNTDEINFHRELAEQLGIALHKDNFGSYDYPNPNDYVINLGDYLDRVYPLAIRLLNEHGITQKYVLDESSFNKRLNRIKEIQKLIQSPQKKLLKSTQMQPHYDSLNQILFGPPGTGKTYNTIEKAINIIDPEFIPNLKGDKKRNIEFRKNLRDRFQQLTANEQIYFVTFHQSSSYEDFIEGIKPHYNEKKTTLEYPVQPGVFKRICLSALKSIVIANEENIDSDNIQKEDDVNFDVLYRGFVEKLRKEYFATNYPFKTLEGSELRFEEGDLFDNYMFVKYRWNNNSTKTAPGKTPFRISKEILEKMYKGGLTDRETNIKTALSPYITYNKSPYYAVYKYLYGYIVSILSKIDSVLANDKNSPLSEIDIENQLDENYKYYLERYESFVAEKNQELLPGERFVLIIDEINRGNIAQIFGELITLIEDDKRLGSREAIELILPYSKERFTVPCNLHIIGTMNTADRSVEALDTALRRRFQFEEMQPKPELLTPERMLWQFWWDNENIAWEEPELVAKEIPFYQLLGFPNNLNTSPEKGKYWQPMEDEKTPNETQINLLVPLVAAFDGINLSQLLIRINKRIEKLLSKDYMIGHAYLINIRSLSDLKNALFSKILPLLQEYFYGDYGRIGLVIGAKFIDIVKPAEVVFMPVTYDIGDLDDNVVCRVKTIADFDDDDEFLTAVKEIYA
jgi:5-methylcytosine-specific restriction protein B